MLSVFVLGIKQIRRKTKAYVLGAGFPVLNTTFAP